MRELEKTIVSDCGRFKAEIEHRPSGSFRITLFTWYEGWVPEYGKEEFWQFVPDHVIITDTLESAERLAQGEFGALASQGRPDTL